MNLMLNPLSKRTPVTPQTNPELWYSWYNVVKEDAPEVLDQFIENTAAKMELTVDYFTAEFFDESTCMLLITGCHFRQSEYGGLITLIAENDAEALELLSDEESFNEDYGHLIMEKIITANKLSLLDEYESGIIEAFCT